MVGGGKGRGRSRSGNGEAVAPSPPSPPLSLLVVVGVMGMEERRRRRPLRDVSALLVFHCNEGKGYPYIFLNEIHIPLTEHCIQIGRVGRPPLTAEQRALRAMGRLGGMCMMGHVYVLGACVWMI